MRVLKFTLIELLIVISIVLLLASILSPSLQKIQNSSFSTKCQNNLKIMHSGLSLYLGDYDNIMPGPVFSIQSPIGIAGTGRYQPRNLSNRFIEYLPRYEEIFDYDDDLNYKFTNFLICPSGLDTADDHLSEKPYKGYYYVLNNLKIDGEGIYGRPKYTDDENREHDMVLPKSLYIVENLNEIIFLEDADQFNYNSSRVNQYPAHQAARNNIMLDGSVSVEIWQ